MSAPRADSLHPSLLSYGFLATRAEKAARLLDQHQTLSPADIEALRDGMEFLRKISKGAEYLTTRKFYSQDLVGALDALSVAMDPIKTLSDLFGNQQISQIFAEAANAVSKQLDNGEANMSEAEKKQIQIFRSFFDALYVYVSSVLERDTPVIGSGSRGKSLKPISP